MNRNRKCSKKVAAGIAVGMAAVDECSTGTGRRRGRIGIKRRRDSIRQCRCLRNKKNVTVSSWLKNAGSEKELKDSSDLQDIVNVKGDKTFSQDGEGLTWNTDDKDIYYQGTTDKELPVNVKLTYYLDGQEMAGKT